MQKLRFLDQAPRARSNPVGDFRNAESRSQANETPDSDFLRDILLSLRELLLPIRSPVRGRPFASPRRHSLTAMSVI